MAHRKLYTSGLVERLGLYSWAIVDTYAVTNAAARGLENRLWGKLHPDHPVLIAPRCRRIRRQTNWLPGITKLTAYYRSGGGRPTPGKARLRIDLMSTEEAAKFDQGDPPLQLDGPIHTADTTDGLNYARITKGSRSVPRPASAIRLDTAYERNALSARAISETIALVGTVNDRALHNFGNFPRGTLLLLGAPTTHVWDEDELWYVTYSFGVELRGWNTLTKRQVVTKVPRKMSVVDSTGAIDAEATRRVVLAEVAKQITGFDANGDPTLKATVEEDTQLFQYANFAGLDAMVQWW